MNSKRNLCLANAILVSSLLGTVGCSKQEEQAAIVRPVQTVMLGAASAEPFRRFPGEVSAVETSRMSFDLAGRLVEFPATQGMVVAEGTLLARLDETNFVARLDSARADFNNAKDEFERRRQLFDRGVISESEFNTFRQSFEVAEAALREAQRAVDDTRLVAPFDGRVAQTFVNNFQSVQAKESILLFQDVSTLEVDINVPENDMLAAQRGTIAEDARERVEAFVEFPAIRGERFPVELESFATQASATSRTFPVTFKLIPPENGNILPGMTCTVLVRVRPGSAADAGDPGVYSLPVQAVSTSDGRSWIWRLNPETMTVSRIGVELLGFSGSEAQVSSAELAEGNEIVTTGVRFLADGMEVSRLAAGSR